MNAKRISFVACAVLALSPATVATAADKNWVGGSGNWSAGANWNVGTVPAAGDSVYIAPTDGAARTINYNVSAPSLYGLNVDLTGPGENRTTFQMSSGTLTNVGFIIGDFGRATVNQSGGSFVQNDPTFDGAVGYNAGGNGIYNLSGTGSLSLAKDFYIGNIGTGAVNQSGGMVDIARDLFLGTSGGTGAYTLSGGRLSIGGELVGELFVGSSGSRGTLMIEDGGSVSINYGSSIGLSAGSTGTATVTGAGSTWTNSYLAVGDEGEGTLTISDGGSVSNYTGHIGFGPNSTGTVTVTGAGSTWTNSGFLDIGTVGTATLEILNGGTVSNTEGQIAFFGSGSRGTVIVEGAGSTWTMTERLSIGGDADDGTNGGTGTLHIQPGGTVGVAQGIVLFPDSLVRLEGGTLATTAFDFRGGQFDWTSGTLHVDTFNGNLTNPNGTLAPGRSAGSTTILGNYTQQAGAALEIEIGGTSAGGTHDLMNVTGNALIGGQLNLAMLNGFVPSTGDTFTVLNAAGGIFGVFANITTGQRLATTDGIGSFLVHYGPGSAFNQNQIVLSAFELANSGGLPGDYNQNGAVDAADYTVWRDNLGSGTALANDDTAGVGQDDYTRWKTHFGETTGSGSAETLSTHTAVPEPATWWLALLGMAMIAARRTVSELE